jgi:hypothetical protein
MQVRKVDVKQHLDSNTAAINLQMPPSHEPAVLAHQERDHTRNIAWVAEPLQRSLLLQFRQLLFAPAVLVAGCLDYARVDGVDADAVLAEFLSSSQSDSAKSELGGAVGDEAGEAAQAGDGGADYYGAAVVGGLHGCCGVFDA